jgi:hypothetical protein
MFRSGRKELDDINISFGYETMYFVFGSREFYETISFVLHFIITQYIKNRCARMMMTE